MFADTLCFRTTPIFHRNNYFLDAQKHVSWTPFVFGHPYFSPKLLFFIVRKHRVITVHSQFSGQGRDSNVRRSEETSVSTFVWKNN